MAHHISKASLLDAPLSTTSMPLATSATSAKAPSIAPLTMPSASCPSYPYASPIATSPTSNSPIATSFASHKPSRTSSTALSLCASLALASIFLESARADWSDSQSTCQGSSIGVICNITSSPFGTITAQSTENEIWANRRGTDLDFILNVRQGAFSTGNFTKQGAHIFNLSITGSATITTANFNSFNDGATISIEDNYMSSSNGSSTTTTNNSPFTTINIDKNAGRAPLTYTLGNSQTRTISTITKSHAGEFILRATSGGQINVTTLTVSAGTLQKEANGTITTLKMQGGTANIQNGTIATLSTTAGQSALNLNNGATITTANQSGGSLELAARGTVSTYNLNGGGLHLKEGTISALNQSNGSFTLGQGAKVSTYMIKTQYTTSSTGSSNSSGAGGSTSGGSTSSTNANIGANNINSPTSTVSSSTAPTASTILLANTQPKASFTNFGHISNLTIQANDTSILNENGASIDSLTHSASSTLSIIQSGGRIGSLSNTNSGAINISSLDNVAQSTRGGLSTITISGAGNINVDNLDVSLQGNNAISRVKINTSTSGSSSNGASGSSSTGKLTAKHIEVVKLDSAFNPNAKIPIALKDYVDSSSQSHVDASTTPSIGASVGLQGLGISFNSDGTPQITTIDSLSGTLSSIIITQSMRRKLLSDIYLSEQTRRSLKGSEKENLARERAALLASPAVAKYQKDKAQYDKELQAWHAKANTPENKKLIADYEKAKASYDKQKEAYDKLSNKAKKKAKAPKEPTKPDIIAKAPKEPKEPLNYRSAKEQYEKDLQAWHAKANTPENKKLIADYEKAKANYEKAKADYNKLSANAKKKAKAPQEPKEPAILTQRPDYIPSPQEYQRAKKQYDLDIKEWNKLAHTPANRKIIAAYEKAKKKYDKDLAKYQEWEQSGKNGKAPKAPTKPIEPDILTKKPTLPISPNLDPDVVASLEAGVNDVVGDFFIRALGSAGGYDLENGSLIASYSAGAMLGGNKLIRIGNGYGVLGFYGGYEYIQNNGSKTPKNLTSPTQDDATLSTLFNINSQSGFAGVRFSHLFAQSKLAGLYYILGADGGYGQASLNQTYVDDLSFRTSLNLYSYGTSLRLGSTIYLNGLKSMLIPSIGTGLEGGVMSAFDLESYSTSTGAIDTNGLQYHSDVTIYDLGYGQADLSYYQEWGNALSTTFGGGARYLINPNIPLKTTINGYVPNDDAMLSLSQLYYYGSAFIGYSTGIGAFSAGYTYIQGGTGMTHNASLRYHYFF